MKLTKVDSFSDCWVLLAEAILLDYAKQYADEFPKGEKTQADYSTKDLLYYQPRRVSIIWQLRHGPIRRAVDVDVCKRAFNQQRESRKKELNVNWVG